MTCLVGVLGAIAFFLLCLGLSLLCALALAEPHDRKIVVQYVFAGLVIACIKVWLVQLAPQWLDTPLDAVKYQLHAQALAAHWQGEVVEAVPHKLAGLQAHGMQVWLPDANLPYSFVLGTHEWLYAAFLAIWALVTPDWPIWAIYSSAALAALFPAGAFGIARALGASTRVAIVAAALALFDPSAAVNGAWLLKDTWACWFVIVALWSGLCILGKTTASLRLVMLLVLSLGILGGVRFMGMAAIYVAVITVLPALVVGRQVSSILELLISCFFGLFLFVVLNSVPVVDLGALAQRPLLTVRGIILGQASTLSSSQMAASSTTSVEAATAAVGAANSSVRSASSAIDVAQDFVDTAKMLPPEGAASAVDTASSAVYSASTAVAEASSAVAEATTATEALTHVDATVADWYARLSEAPATAIIMAAARTLFAPYPWVVARDGLGLKSGIELYYLGTVLWIFCLPGIFRAFYLWVIRPNIRKVFVILVLGACLAAYIIFLGEWSTRQRVFMLPVFFALASIGWADLAQRLRYWIRRTRS